MIAGGGPVPVVTVSTLSSAKAINNQNQNHHQPFDDSAPSSTAVGMTTNKISSHLFDTRC
jgi:hypothetical protein